jgi:iron-sulfur cluster assembly enzyme ISCU, mitochondrial
LQIHPTAPLDTQIVFAMFSLSLLKRIKVCQKGTIFARLYHENIIDHYENPRNVGSLDKKKITVGTGLVGAPACGDVMKLQFEVDDTGRIIDAKFKTFGCGSAIASSSVATEWLKGKTVDECLTIKVKMLSIL